MISVKDLRELTKDLTILYAEDELWLRENMAETLKRLFHCTLIAENGEEAVQYFKTNPVDLILTDINMPKMNGVDLIKAVHELSDLPPPIIVLTAHTESELLMELIDLNIDKFINKPVDKQKLITTLYKVCHTIVDARLLEQYRLDLEDALMEAEKKNRILETKIKQIAIEKNDQQKKTAETAPLLVSENHSIPDSDHYFEMLVSEDRDELEDLGQEIESYITLMFKTDAIDEKYLGLLADAYMKYGAILYTYPIFYDIGMGLTHLAQTMNSHYDVIYREQEKCAFLFESFHFSLDTYRMNIWYNKQENPAFYNSSLLSDIQYLSNYLLGSDDEENVMELF